MNIKAVNRKYAFGDRVTVVDIAADKEGQPGELLLKHCVVTEPTNGGWTRVAAIRKDKDPVWGTGWYFKQRQLVPVNDGVVFVAMHQVLIDFQAGIELDTALTRNGFRMIEEKR